MGHDINVNNNGVPKKPAEEVKNNPETSQNIVQNQNNLNNDISFGLTGYKMDFNALNSGLGFGGIFGASQLNVNEQELADLSKSFLGFSMSASNMPFGMGENFMTSTMSNWFQSFMGCFTNGTQVPNETNPLTQVPDNQVKTTLIEQPKTDKPDKTEQKSTDKSTENKPNVENEPKANVEKTKKKPHVETDSEKKIRLEKEAADKKVKEDELKAEANKKSLASDDLTTKNKEQFLMWLDKKGFKSKVGNDKNLIDYTDASGNNVRVGFNDAGQPTRIIQGKNDTLINYNKNGSKSVFTRTKESERYTYDTNIEYDAKGRQTSYKKTEQDSGNYFTREWVGASGVKNRVLIKREYGLTKPIQGIEKEVSPPAFKSGSAGFEYDPQKGTLEGKDISYKKTKDGGFNKTDKKTGIMCEYSKEGKLIRQFDYKNGVIRNFKKDGSYDQHYNKDWVKV